jgi:anthranilate phosphoribosyltransferase
VAGKAGSLADGVRLADQAIAQGLGAKKLEEIRRVTV